MRRMEEGCRGFAEGEEEEEVRKEKMHPWDDAEPFERLLDGESNNNNPFFYHPLY